MVYHIGILVLVLIFTLIYAVKGEKQLMAKRYCVIGCTIAMGLLLGLRTWWMADLVKYHTLYVNCGGTSWKEYVFEKAENIGIRLFFHYEYILTNGNFHIALFIIAFFCMSCLGYVIYKYSVSPYWSYLMFICMGYYFFNFTGLKQSIAMAFLLLAFVGIAEDRPKYFLVMTFFAGCFHAPAFIFLPAYAISKIRINRTYWLSLVGVFAGVFVLRGPIVSFLSDLYYDADSVDISSGGVGGKFLMMMAILVAGYLLRPLDDEDKIYSKVFNIMIIAALFQSFSIFGNNFTRLADYYYQLVILFVPFIFEDRRFSKNKLSKNARQPIFAMNNQVLACMYILVTAFSVWYYYQYISSDISGILDYKFFWQVVYQ